MGIREEMPLLARHEGEWEGTYTYVDLDGMVVDRHNAQLTCTLPNSGDWDYYQINRYTWEDGRTEEHRFPGSYLGQGRCAFDTERIKGEFWAVDDDTIYLSWIYKESGADLRLFELIVLSPDGNTRSRVWQWVRGGKCIQRTLIDETRVES
ncbi:DUF3598 family protein [Streptosporangium roseum]|uniref:DUF3598 family protein n=1 Tax=Streptosporangium roseum TaxID=2001 RepID=UPI0004CD4B1D|nr:DUF3598 family protein [Streptosporangium roseum]